MVRMMLYMYVGDGFYQQLDVAVNLSSRQLDEDGKRTPHLGMNFAIPH